MAGRGSGPDFVESLARGLDILACFGTDHRTMSLSEVATAAGLARPTARRLLLTLEELGYVRASDGAFTLPNVNTSELRRTPLSRVILPVMTSTMSSSSSARVWLARLSQNSRSRMVDARRSWWMSTGSCEDDDGPGVLCVLGRGVESVRCLFRGGAPSDVGRE